jgi:predicted transcriptional regulator
MEALNHQLSVLEDKAKETRDEEGRIRYNFMKIAKAVLTRETYEKIRNMSDNSLRDMKPMFKEFRQNKSSS